VARAEFATEEHANSEAKAEAPLKDLGRVAQRLRSSHGAFGQQLAHSCVQGDLDDLGCYSHTPTLALLAESEVERDHLEPNKRRPISLVWEGRREKRIFPNPA